MDLADLVAGTGSGTLTVPGRDHVVVPITTVARLACDANVTTILTHCAHGAPLQGSVLALREQSREILWVGRAQRLLTPRCGRPWWPATAAAGSPAATATSPAARPTTSGNGTMTSVRPTWTI